MKYAILSEDVYLTWLYETEEDVKIKARLSKLESVLGYGTEEFHSKVSNMLSEATYDRIATFGRVAPTVFRSHGDFIADVAEIYAEHSIEKVCQNEKIKASKIDSKGLEVHEMVQEHRSSRG